VRLEMVFLVGALLCPSGLLAQESGCAEAETQAEMNACAAQDFKEADAALNETYLEARDHMRALDVSLGPDQAGAEQALLQAQRAWISFRDLSCAAEGYAYHGGSIEPMVVNFCLARLTAVRRDDLAALASPEGGN
jgi:uncharacterized protein YecT (DUF1311 family)